MTPEDINKTAWEVWAKARKEVMCADQVAILAAALVAEREKADRLQDVIDSRPAINAALPDSYIKWSQSIYVMEVAHATGAPS